MKRGAHFMLEIKAGKKYLWFPVKSGGEKSAVEIIFNQTILDEFEVEVNGAECDFYAAWDASGFIGQTLMLEGSFSEEWAKAIRCEDSLPNSPRQVKRPFIHFAPQTGWLNDPNGMIFVDGLYHMYFQHNPYGTGWANMHWGHAVSRDLIHWEQQAEALYPDENGMMFSGSAFLDSNNTAGFGENAILYYYTAAPRTFGRSKGKRFTQRLAVSTDGGFLLEKSDRFVMEHIVGENRDPKVFYHAASKAYILVMFLDSNDFAIYRSENLLDWTHTQTLTFDTLWECPDLFPLKNEKGEERWIFWAADGYYYIGEFDGFNFTPHTGKLEAYSAKLAYAAQTYSNLGERIVSQSWLHTQNHGTLYTGIMAIPAELSLKTTSDGERIAFAPVREMDALRRNVRHFETGTQETLLTLRENAGEVLLNFHPDSRGIAVLDILGNPLTVDFSAGSVSFGENIFHFAQSEALDLRIYIDYDVVEIFALGGRMYFPCEWNPLVLTGNVTLNAPEGVLKSADSFELESAGTALDH